MASGFPSEETTTSNIWLISNGQPLTDFDTTAVTGEKSSGSVKEYRISDLAKYLLDPSPIEVMNRLVGYKIIYPTPAAKGLGRFLGSRWPKKLRPRFAARTREDQTVLSDFRSRLPAMRSTKLSSHVHGIIENLLPHDRMLKHLDKLNPSKVADLVGICEDVEGNGSLMHLSGSLEDKIAYIKGYALKEVGVILEKAQFKNGLFELRGFDFRAFNPENAHRMLRISGQGKTRVFVLAADGTPVYEIENLELVKFLYFLEMSLKCNDTLQDLFRQCTRGWAKPLKMLFTSKIEVDYSRENLPKPYREVLASSDAGPLAMDIVAQALNQRQHAISLNYIPQSTDDPHKPLTSIYIIHDVRALEPIKSTLPRLYAQISEKLLGGEKGPYYLMDAIGGVRNA